MQLLSALKWRYAVKKFTPTTLPRSQVEALITATQLSPSAYGLQPYRLIVVDSPTVRQQLLAHSYGQTKVVEASHLFILAVDKIIGDHTVDNFIEQMSHTMSVSAQSLNNMANHYKAALRDMSSEERNQWAHRQAHIALGNLLTSAALLEVDACPMAGFNAFEYDRVLKLASRGLTSSVMCALGYRHPDDQHASRPKVRTSLDSFVITL